MVQSIVGYDRLDPMFRQGRLLSFIPDQSYIFPRSFFLLLLGSFSLLLLGKVITQRKWHWHGHVLFGLISCCKRLVHAIAVLLAIWLPLS